MMLYDMRSENKAKVVRNNSERSTRCEEEQWLVGTDLDDHTRTLDANGDASDPYQICEKIQDGRLRKLKVEIMCELPSHIREPIHKVISNVPPNFHKSSDLSKPLQVHVPSRSHINPNWRV
jgi:hypothetical protein